ncbi:hypothetical protein HD554DRAFT_2121492, partial [Boletus coccyginus]
MTAFRFGLFTTQIALALVSCSLFKLVTDTCYVMCHCLGHSPSCVLFVQLWGRTVNTHSSHYLGLIIVYMQACILSCQ